jgi:hypothetical protein
MRRNHQCAIIVDLFMLVGLIALCSSAGAQPISHLKLDTHRASWSHLSYHAKNFWVEVSTDIQMKSIQASDLEAVLPASPKGKSIKPKTSQMTEIIVNTVINSRFRSPVKIHNRVWFNPANAAAIGRIRIRRGEDDFKKMYRFTDQGVFRHRIEPKNKSEAMLEPDEWTDIKDNFYPYDMNQLNCPSVSERSALVYILSAVAMSKSDTPQTICVFGKRQLHRVQLKKEGIHPIKVDYIEKKQEKEIRKDSVVKAFKIVISAQPFSPHSEDPENFSFLGFHKDISVYIEPASGLPVHISGIIPTVGRADLKLSEVRLKQAPN